MKLRPFILFCIILVIGYGHSVYSLSRVNVHKASSFVEFTDDMQYFLVMLTDGSSNLPKKYPKSGLYRLDGSSRDPLWTVDWYSTSVFPDSSGRYLVRLFGGEDLVVKERLSRAEQKYNMENRREYLKKQKSNSVAISFYDNGVLLQRHRVGDLFEDTGNFKEDEFGGFRWLRDRVFDNDANIIKLATFEDVSYSFSISTGEILEQEKYIKTEYDEIWNNVKRKMALKRSDALAEPVIRTILDLVDTDLHMVKKLGEPYLSDYSLAKRIIGAHGATYRYFNDKLKDERELSMLAITSGNASPLRSLGKHRKDKRIMIASVKYDGRNYQYLPDDLKNDKKLLLRALENYGGMRIYSMAPENLQDDREVILTALRAQLLLLDSSVRIFHDTKYPSRFYLNDLGSIPEKYLKDSRIKHLIDAIIEVRSVTSSDGMAEKRRMEIYTLIRKNSAR